MFIGELGAILEIKSKIWDLLQIAFAEIPAGVSNSSCRLEFVETTKTFQQVKLSWLWLCLGQNLGNYWSFPRLIAKIKECKAHMKHNCKWGSYSSTDVSDTRRESKPSWNHWIFPFPSQFLFPFKSLMRLKEEKFKIRSELRTPIRDTEVAVVDTRIKSWAVIIASSEKSWAPVLQQGFTAPGWPWYKV